MKFSRENWLEANSMNFWSQVPSIFFAKEVYCPRGLGSKVFKKLAQRPLIQCLERGIVIFCSMEWFSESPEASPDWGEGANWYLGGSWYFLRRSMRLDRISLILSFSLALDWQEQSVESRRTRNKEGLLFRAIIKRNSWKMTLNSLNNILDSSPRINHVCTLFLLLQGSYLFFPPKHRDLHYFPVYFWFLIRALASPMTTSISLLSFTSKYSGIYWRLSLALRLISLHGSIFQALWVFWRRMAWKRPRSLTSLLAWV